MSENTEPTNSPAILLVDDEPNVLKSLRRVLRGVGAAIHSAGDGPAALEVLRREPVDLIISDMRMPQMSGAKLLAEVARQWPRVVRILLTGYSDMESTVEAVNEGHIYQYLSKPWDDRDLALLVRNALEKKRLEDERATLLEQLEEKNRALEELNQTLERRVRQRTASLQKTLAERDAANEKLRRQFFDIVKVLSRIIDLRPSIQPGLAKLVADQCKRVAVELTLPEKQVHDVIFAGLLFQVGRLTLPERFNERPFFLLHPKEREQVLDHVLEGDALLNQIESLREVARIIRAQHEKFDGSGTPDGLKGGQIPIGARILAIVRDYNLYQSGAMTGQAKNVAEAQRTLERSAGSHYDPEVLSAFFRSVGRIREKSYQLILSVLPCQLREGMEVVQVRDKDSGKVFLQGGVLDRQYIDKILELRDELGVRPEIKIRIRIS